MTLLERIERAFAHREMPAETVQLEGMFQIDSDVDDALCLKGRDWHELTCEHWRAHYCGLYHLSPEAFAYYLPSLLVLTVQDPKNYPDLAVDALFLDLDRSCGAEHLDAHLIDRYSVLTNEEYEAVKQWLLFACENIPDAFWGAAVSGPGDGFGRVFDTIDLLQKETAARRSKPAQASGASGQDAATAK